MTDVLNIAKVDHWAGRITESWDHTRESYFVGITETGADLIEAKVDCTHGEWMVLVGSAHTEGRLPFGYKTAQMLMRIARFTPFQNGTTGSILPPSWRTYYALAQLKEDGFQEAVDAGIVSQETTRMDVRHWVKAQNRTNKHKEIANAAFTDANGHALFSLIYADPPWTFKTYSEKGKDIAPDQHYPTMSDGEICTLKYGERWIGDCLAPDCLLFLWCTPANLIRAQGIMEAWGFEYRSHMVWVKDKAGTGFYTRQMHEPILIGVRGKPPMPEHVPPSAVEAPRGKHSEKPSIFRETLEQMYPHWGKEQRIELFARGPAPDWSVFGYEAQH